MRGLRTGGAAAWRLDGGDGLNDFEFLVPIDTSNRSEHVALPEGPAGKAETSPLHSRSGEAPKRPYCRSQQPGIAGSAIVVPAANDPFRDAGVRRPRRQIVRRARVARFLLPQRQSCRP